MNVTHDDATANTMFFRSARKAHECDIDYSCTYDHGEKLDIDSLIENIVSCKTNNSYSRANRDSHMPKDVCLRLSQNSKVAWNKLNDDSKAIILSSSKPTKNAFTQASIQSITHCASKLC